MKAKNLSGGEKIKFRLILEMMKDPTLLLLDEPSNDLDIASLEILENFINASEIPVLFISHDELLLDHCADTIIHIEQLQRRHAPRQTIANLGYSAYIDKRARDLDRQEQLANKEKEEHEAKMLRYEKIQDRVEFELRNVSRQDPGTAKNLKDKMRSVKSMGKRFAKEKESLTEKPQVERKIDLKFEDGISLSNKKMVLDLQLPELKIGDKHLAGDIALQIRGPEKICIIGKNGAGKSTLLKVILQELDAKGHSYTYMPQNYGEALDENQSAVEFISKDFTNEEEAKIRAYLGAYNFTQEEVGRKISGLSGGQKAKLYFAKMIFQEEGILVMDEPTRNLSPHSGPEIRKALRNYPGAIISVSHDRKFIEEVCDVVYSLDETGLKRIR